MISIVEFIAHCPAVGVNEYVVVPLNAVEIVDGLQLPLTPFVELAGNDGATEF